jgi:hypothetical protein
MENCIGLQLVICKGASFSQRRWLNFNLNKKLSAPLYKLKTSSGSSWTSGLLKYNIFSPNSTVATFPLRIRKYDERLKGNGK